MKFDYIVKRYTYRTKEVRVLGGFLNINAAKKYAETKAYDFMSGGYCFVTAPEGDYILGEADYRVNSESKWYKSGENVLVYYPATDQVLTLNEAKNK